jgi:hypothetical protein
VNKRPASGGFSFSSRLLPGLGLSVFASCGHAVAWALAVMATSRLLRRKIGGPSSLRVRRRVAIPYNPGDVLDLVTRDLAAHAILSPEHSSAVSSTSEGGCRLRLRQGFPPFDPRGLRPLSRMELVEIRMTVEAVIWARNANVSAPIPHEFNGLFDSRRSRVPFERQCAG